MDDVEVEVAVLIEVEEAGGHADRGRAGLGHPGRLGDVLEGSAAVAEEAVVAGAGEVQVHLAIGIEVARGGPEADAISREVGRLRDVLEPAVAGVPQQHVAQPPLPDHRRGQEQVEPAVAVGVERDDRGSEAGPGPTDDRLAPV